MRICLIAILTFLCMAMVPAVPATQRAGLPNPLPVPPPRYPHPRGYPFDFTRETVHTGISIELLVIQASAIFRGTVWNVEKAAGGNYAVFNMSVDEVLKAPPGETPVTPFIYFVDLDARGNLPAVVAPGRQLLLIKYRNEPSPLDQYFPLFALDAPIDPPFFTMFGKAVRTGDDLLAAMRTAIRETPVETKRNTAGIAPINAEMRAVMKQHHPSLEAPVDARAQKLALQMIASGEDWQEWQALYILHFLPTAENIARLEGYLTDNRLGPVERPLSPWSRQPYRYRVWASQLLESMSGPPKGAVLDRPATLYRGFSIWWMLLGAGVVSGAWYGLGRMRWFRPRGVRLALFSVVYLAGVGGLYFRSGGVIDDFCFTVGDQLYSVSFHKHRMRYQRLNGFTHPTPLVHASFKPAPPGEPAVWHQFDEVPRVCADICVPGQTSPFPGEPFFTPANYVVRFYPLWYLALPAVLGLLGPLTLFSGAARRRRRVARGLCPECGYDLQAHRVGEKCPECGNVIAASAVKTGGS